MQQRTLWVLLLSGLGLVLCGIGLLSVNAPVYAQDVETADINLENATYVGVRECSLCHRPVLRDHHRSRHASTLQNVSLNAGAVLADFGQGEDVRTLLFPGTDEPRPFEVNDIAYTLGTGMNVQRYLYRAAPDEYMVLPAQWNVNTQSWEPYGDTEQWPNDSYAFGPNCAGCHTTDLHTTEEFFWEEDGVQCESCHGPGSLHVEAVSDNADPAVIRASIVLSPDPQICGQCHSQGVEPETGFPYPSGYRPGQANLLDEDVFTFVPPDDEAHWWSTGHAREKYMQFNESLVSAHASALTDMLESDSADESCLQCHSGDFRWVQDILALDEGDYEVTAPEQVTLESAQFGVTCVNCHEPHGNPELPTLLRADTYTMCAGCHSNPPEDDSIHYPAREMFEGVQLIGNINVSPSAHFTAEEGPRCATCHMPDVPVQQAGVRDSHRWTPILPGTTEQLNDSCTGCHTEFVDVEGMRQLVETIRASTQARLDAAKTALTDEHPEWVAQALAFVENDGSEGIHNYAYANTLLTNAESALGITTPLDQPNLEALADVSDMPDVQAESAPFTPESFGGGLTLPSIILLGIGALIIGAAAYAFFLRRPR